MDDKIQQARREGNYVMIMQLQCRNGEHLLRQIRYNPHWENQVYLKLYGNIPEPGKEHSFSYFVEYCLICTHKTHHFKNRLTDEVITW